jgi:hypothetical protein
MFMVVILDCGRAARVQAAPGRDVDIACRGDLDADDCEPALRTTSIAR